MLKLRAFPKRGLALSVAPMGQAPFRIGSKLAISLRLNLLPTIDVLRVAMDNLTRQSMIEALQRGGNAEAWQRFASIYRELILRWLRSQGCQLNDAEDVCQETLAAVLSEIKNFEHNGRPGAFRRWLRQIMSFRLRRMWQKKSDEQRRLSSLNLSAVADQMEDDQSPMSKLWDQEHDAFVLDRLLNDLSDQFSPNSIAAFRRIAIEQEPAEQVAADLKMTLGAVRVAQHRVLKALKSNARELVD